MSGVIATEAPWSRHRLALLTAGSAAFSVSTMFSSMKPVLIARLVEEAHYSPRLAGLVAAMPFIGGIFASALLPGTVRRWDPSGVVAILGLALVIIEAANAFVIGSPVALLGGQFLAGLCGGLLIGLTSAVIALSARAEQSFGIVDTVAVLLMSAMVTIVGVAVGRDGLRGGFLCAAVLCAAFALALIGSRRSMVVPAMEVDTRPSGGVDIGWRPVMVIAMGVIFVTFSGLGFAFMFTAARQLGYGYEAASSAIGVILFVSAFGCLAGGWCAARFGAKRSLIVAFVLCAVGWQLALTTHSPAVFIVALAPAIGALQFSFPILFSMAGALDDEGRIAAIAAPLIVSGFAWAAIVAGLVVDRWGIAALPVLTEIGMAVCAGLLLAATHNDVPIPAALPSRVG